jgi:Skp family chaperone for outer membrane proteins
MKWSLTPLLMLLFVSLSHAQNFGVVDPQKIVYTSAIGKKKMAEIKTFRDSKQAEIDSIKKSDPQKAQRLREDTQKEIQNRMSATLKEMENKVFPIIEKVAIRKGYDFVLQKEQVVYNNPKIDITDEVIQILDSQP